ncbi:MAG: hypothetical protein ACXAC7_10760 [Candidatus Hodarchaeales archaeon]|jgi:hypothetical protein
MAKDIEKQNWRDNVLQFDSYKKHINEKVILHDGRKWFIPVHYGMIISLITSIAILMVFSVLSAGTVPILAQIEVILLSISFCLPGILARSKLRGLIACVPIAWIVFLLYQMVISVILADMAYNPFAVFSIMEKPLRDSLSGFDNPDFNESTEIISGLTISDLLSYLIIFDLLLIGIIILFGAFFSASVATWFWDKNGKLVTISVIYKPIAIFFTIVFLLIMPLVVHAACSATGTIAYVAAGSIELYKGLETDEANGAMASQFEQFDLANLDFDKLRLHSQNAEKHFRIADEKISHLKGNLFFSFIKTQGPPALQDAEKLLDLIKVMGELSKVMPELFRTLYNIDQGLAKTFVVIEDAQDSYGVGTSEGVGYDPNFADGLQYFTWAMDNFSYAWDCGEPEGNCGLQEGLERATNIGEVETIQDLVNIHEFSTALSEAVDYFYVVRDAVIPFINGTYESILGMNALANNAFNNASAWSRLAVEDFIKSNDTLSQIGDLSPIDLIINTGDEPTEIPMPIDKIIQVAKDLNTVLIPFSHSAVSAIELFISTDNLLTELNAIDMNDTTTTGLDSTWESVDSNLTKANNDLIFLTNNLTSSKSYSNYFITTGDYGTLTDAFIGEPGSEGVFRTISTSVDDFDRELNDFQDLFSALNYTLKAFRAFGKASGDVELGLQLSGIGDDSVLLSVREQYVYAMDNASIAYRTLSVDLQGSTYLNANSREDWKDILADPGLSPFVNYNDLNNGDASGIYPTSRVMVDLIDTVLTLEQLDVLLGLIEALDLSEIFG